MYEQDSFKNFNSKDFIYAFNSCKSLAINTYFVI